MLDSDSKPQNDASGQTILLNVGANKIGLGQQMNVSAILQDATGQPVAGELVSFFGALGEVSPASAVSDNNGQVTVVYQAGNVAGDARITALAGYASQTVAIQVGERITTPPTATPVPMATPTVEPTVEPTEESTVTATPEVSATPPPSSGNPDATETPETSVNKSVFLPLFHLSLERSSLPLFLAQWDFM